MLSAGRVAQAQSAGSFPEPSAPPSAAPPAAPPPQSYTPAPPVTPPAPAATPPATLPAPAPTYAPPAVYAPTAPSYTPSLTLQNLPPLLPYKKGLPVPPGYRVVERSASGLTLGGGLTFLGAYAAAIGLAASQSFENGTGYAAIPLAGPWAAIAGRTFKKCKAPTTTNSVAALQKAINSCVGTAYDEVVAVVFLTTDGLVQATGAALFFIGLGSNYLELVREDLPKTAVHVLPEGGFGLTVSGDF